VKGESKCVESFQLQPRCPDLNPNLRPDGRDHRHYPSHAPHNGQCIMRRVIVESPYAGNSPWRVIAFFQRMRNRQYARAAVRDSLMRGESPFASHLIYTQPGILRDRIPSERQQGIDAGFAWRGVADATVVYIDKGVSKGMALGIKTAKVSGFPVEFRRIFKTANKEKLKWLIQPK
jgi:hypothetical protein